MKKCSASVFLTYRENLRTIEKTVGLTGMTAVKTIYDNGAVYTDELPLVEAFAVENETISEIPVQATYVGGKQKGSVAHENSDRAIR